MLDQRRSYEGDEDPEEGDDDYRPGQTDSQDSVEERYVKSSTVNHDEEESEAGEEDEEALGQTGAANDVDSLQYFVQEHR